MRVKLCCNSENAEKFLNNNSKVKWSPVNSNLPNIITNSNLGQVYTYLFLCCINLRTAIYCAELAVLSGEMLAALHLLAIIATTTLYYTLTTILLEFVFMPERPSCCTMCI